MTRHSTEAGDTDQDAFHQIPPPLRLGVAPDLAPAPIPLLLGVIATPLAAPAILGVRVAAAAAILLAFSLSILLISSWLYAESEGGHTVLSA